VDVVVASTTSLFAGTAVHEMHSSPTNQLLFTASRLDV